MAPSHPARAPRERLVRALREALSSRGMGDPAGAEKLACVLVGHEQFAAAVGARPGGMFDTLPPPFEAVAWTDDVRGALSDLRATLDGESLEPMSIGQGYEAALDTEARGARGQFFTPTSIADAVVRWALDGADSDGDPPRIMDPATGTGTFLLVGLRRLRARYPGREPATLLDRLVGVDIDDLALRLAGLRLAAGAGIAAPDGLSLHHASFFDCEPVGSAEGVDPAVTLPPVDAVVGNPPFVRAEALQPDTAHFRRHLAAFGPPDETPLLEGSAALSRRSDAYVYFVTHATRFLRPGGRLALVLPTKWLMSEYGEGLRRFLRRRYRVHAVVGFGARAFGDALVDTALLLAERTDDPTRDQSMRFVRCTRPVTAAALLDAVAGDAPSPGGTASVVDRPQTELTASGSLAPYLEAPTGLLSMFDGPTFVRLDELAEVARGTMTGANAFFFVDGGTVDRFGIERQFLRPAVKSLRSIDRPTVQPADVDRWLVDVHGFATSVRAELDDGPDPEAAVKTALADRHDGLAAYVEHAEAAGWQAGRTCQSRSVWFDLGPLRAPAAFVPKLLRERVFAVRNDADAVPSNAIDGVWPAAAVDARALLAVLNASVGKAAMEVTGRDEAGMLQLMTYETASLPTLDVRQLEPPQRRALAGAGQTYADAPGPDTLASLDSAVHEAFDLPISPDGLAEHARTLRARRVDGGETVAVPLD